ncbi:MAG: DNA translocase FtsK, partial [Comamonadaceae bacterium]
GRVPNEGLMLVAGNVFGKQLDDVIKEIKAEVKAKIWPKVTKKPNPATAPAARPEEGAGGLKDKAVPVLKKQPARAAKLSAEEATLGIAAAMQGVEAAASAPWGAVALPAEPAGAVVEDPLFRTAVKVIVRAKKANVRLLIAELSVGPTKALELMDKLEQAGKVSACDERGARKVLVAA